MIFPNSEWNNYQSQKRALKFSEKALCAKLAEMIHKHAPHIEETTFLVIDEECSPDKTHEGDYMCSGQYSISLVDNEPTVELDSSVVVDSDSLIIIAK